MLERRHTIAPNIAAIAMVLGSWVVAAVAVYGLAMAGEPQSQWLVCEVLGACG